MSVHIAIVTRVEDGETEVTDITQQVEKIFENVGTWPSDWDDYVDSEVALGILSIGRQLGVNGMGAKYDLAIAEVERTALRRAEAEALREERVRALLERERRRQAEAPLVAAHLQDWAARLANRMPGGRPMQTKPLPVPDNVVLGSD